MKGDNITHLLLKIQKQKECPRIINTIITYTHHKFAENINSHWVLDAGTMQLATNILARAFTPRGYSVGACPAIAVTFSPGDPRTVMRDDCESGWWRRRQSTSRRWLGWGRVLIIMVASLCVGTCRNCDKSFRRHWNNLRQQSQKCENVKMWKCQWP